MKKFLKRYWFFLLLGVLVLINVILVAHNFYMSNQRKKEYQNFLLQKQSLIQKRQPTINQNIQSGFYNYPCPEIIKNSIQGEKINLRELVGNVIIIRFSRFYRQDLPNLIYLEHLVNKYQDQRLSLFFINSLGKHDKEAVEKIVNLSAPIIEDDAYLSGLFNAYPEDTIIVDRHFTIKFKYHLASKALIFNEVMKWIYVNQSPPNLTSTNKIEKIIQNLTFYDVLNKERRRLGQIKNRKILFTLFTSTCTGCEENTRIQVMKEMAKRLDSDKVKTMFLFGKGNNPNAIRQYAILNDWNEFPFTIGVIEDSKNLSEKDYYKMFRLDTDPRTFIINSTGELLFAETQRTTKLVNFEHLMKLLK